MTHYASYRRRLSAYKYLLNGIREFPSAEALAAELCDHGFRDVLMKGYRWALLLYTPPASLEAMRCLTMR
jgi:ubiquinone/menaquinone biosynthesis C-methylase UbiE